MGPFLPLLSKENEILPAEDELCPRTIMTLALILQISESSQAIFIMNEASENYISTSIQVF